MLSSQRERPATDFMLPVYDYDDPGLLPGVDLDDTARLAALLGDDGPGAPS